MSTAAKPHWIQFKYVLDISFKFYGKEQSQT